MDESKIRDYSNRLNSFKSFSDQLESTPAYSHSIECAFESLSDWSIFNSLDEVKNWFYQKKRSAKMVVKEKPLSELEGWDFANGLGAIVHSSRDFFTVKGIEVHTDSRESGSAWDQPIIEQVGLDGGILGIIRKRFFGIPHYLCEAKEEPGNYGSVQISPSLQATFANINQSHGGRKPYFVDVFMNARNNLNSRILFDAWLAEDGGRLYRKRNRGMLVEVSDDVELPNESFIWLSLFQIKSLLAEDSMVNPHVRGILAHV